jgi:MIP family channel proteins
MTSSQDGPVAINDLTTSSTASPARFMTTPLTTLGRLLLSEAVGTFVLVFLGCGAIMVDARTGGLGTLGIAVAFGLAITVMIATLGHVSGAHFNPAVTAALWARRVFPLHLVVPYVVAQIVGGTAAALTLRASLGRIGNLGASIPSGSSGQSFVWECLLTALLVSVILAVATDRRAAGQPAALAIGGTVALDALVGGPISGASMNPARTLAPALAGGPTTALWVYLTAPLLGAAIAVGLFALLTSSTREMGSDQP